MPCVKVGSCLLVGDCTCKSVICQLTVGHTCIEEFRRFIGCPFFFPLVYCTIKVMPPVTHIHSDSMTGKGT